MVCTVCQTPLPQGYKACPACGHRAGQQSAHRPTPKPPTRPRKKVHSALDLDLDKEGAAVTPPDVGVEEEGAEELAEVEEVVPVSAGVDPNPPDFTLDPAGLRKLLWGQPELLEKGLSIYTDQKGRPVGAGYNTTVGEIDLLARDLSGALVVVMVSERDQGEEIVADVLQRIGWVRKHLGKRKQKIRGIVLLEEPPENLSYAAAAVADTVAFKTYRVALAFDDVDIS